MGTEHLELAAQRMGALILDLVRERGLSQEQLSPLIGMQQSNISKLLRGGVKGLASTHIATAQRCLGLDPHYFFDAILKGDGTYHAYLRRSDAERYSRPVIPAAPADSDAERYTRPVIPAAPASSNTDHSYSQKYETTKGTREREAREAAEKLAKKKGPVRRR